MFHVEQKVIYVVNDPPDHPLKAPGGYCIPNWPQLGLVYTVRATFVFDGVHCIHLAEIRNPIREYNVGRFEAAFLSSRFRPVVEKKTDISALEEIACKVSAGKVLEIVGK